MRRETLKDGQYGRAYRKLGSDWGSQQSDLPWRPPQGGVPGQAQVVEPHTTGLPQEGLPLLPQGI